MAEPTGILRKGALRLDNTGFENLKTQFPEAQSFGGIVAAALHCTGNELPAAGLDGDRICVQLPIIQAPFRVYYAYISNRLHTQVIAPPDYLNPSEICDPDWTNLSANRIVAQHAAADVWFNQVKPTSCSCRTIRAPELFRAERTFAFGQADVLELLFLSCETLEFSDTASEQ